uniref:ornithine decarboxylase n=1 Tax=Candidatus Kentrum sp. LFY TaxID=2126342 RepID=A0A450UGF9_9GAMM|nr:MAG: ornithine decarboxylase [Candidatus Kentron sp. LFY]
MNQPSKFDHFDTPCWLLDPDIVVENYRYFSTLFENAIVAYAVKSNPHPIFLSRLSKAGAHFCVVSTSHLQQLLALNINPQEIVYSHPIKSLNQIEFALQAGVRCFACDSPAEVDKIACFGIPAEIFIRLDVDNTGSMVPLSGKFGVAPDIALELMHRGAQRGLKPIGFTFHVGSQCLRMKSWDGAIETVGSVWEQARKAFHVDFIDIGGGFAVPYPGIPAFHQEDISALIYRDIECYLPGVRRIVLEPGRAISATAGALLVSVIGIAERPDGNIWLYIDAGIFSGLFEILDNFRYPVSVIPAPENSARRAFLQAIRQQNPSRPDSNGQYTYVLGGQTCDSTDKLFDFSVPKPIAIGDRLLLKNTGAYGYSLESRFNGYELPSVEILSLEGL